MEETSIYAVFTRAFTAVGIFFIPAIEQLLIWIIVMFSVVLCDMLTGWQRCRKMNEKWRFSRSWRDTMGKMVTYFSVVLMLVILNLAMGGGYNIDKLGVLFVCLIEACSIVSNILRPRGIHINLGVAISILLKKLLSIDRSDTEGLITKTKDKEETK